MALKHWKILSTEIKSKNPWWEYRVDKFELPSGKTGEYNYIHSGGNVAVVPFFEDSGKFLLQKQYRYLFKTESLEFPAGWVPLGGDPEKFAHNELIEEAGYDGDLIRVGKFKPAYGLFDGEYYVYLATNLRRSDERKKEDTEDFEKYLLTASQVDEKVLNGEIDESNMVAAWIFAKRHLGIKI